MMRGVLDIILWSLVAVMVSALILFVLWEIGWLE
jgi:hypothetical protein